MTSNMREQADVVIIGGGPAGSALSILLSKAGRSVIQLERETFPREHIGEGLIPSAVPVLERLGIKKELDKRGYNRKRGTTFVWGDNAEPWTVYFVEGNPSAGYSYQLYRPEFDDLLLDLSAENGARVYREHEAMDPIMDGDRIVGVNVRCRKTGNTFEAHGRFVIDASGQWRVLGEKFGGREWDPQIRNMAVYGYFENAGRLPGIDSSNTLVEGFEDGWFWAIPLHVGLLSVGAVLDLEEYKRLKEGDWTEALMDKISKTHKVKELVEGATMTKGPYTLRDWSYKSERFWGPGFALLGDAACFIDPLFSTGVFLGMQHAEILNACINSVFRGDCSEEDAFNLYEREYRAEYEDLRQICMAMYSGAAGPRNSIFWNARRIQRLPERVSARSAFARLISGRERRGFELNPLTRLDLPDQMSEDLKDFEKSLRARIAVIDDHELQGAASRILKESTVIDERHAFLDAVLIVPEEVTSENRLLVKGDFLKRGYVLNTRLNPRGVSSSEAVVEQILPLVDGTRTVREIADLAVEQNPEMERNFVIRELANLYWYAGCELADEDREDDMIHKLRGDDVSIVVPQAV